ncbi:DEAD/DEAH box helicase [Hyphomonas sp.]|uniref:DEAD/DEAH box helicase n=1 Tax=Hyphomonas sp. TaxID=87 RepID=UPI00391C466B
MTSFQSFGFTERLARALTEAGYTTPTPIQAGAIPLIQSGRDVLGLAQTGTGKTLAFAAPIIDRLSRKSGPAPVRGTRVLVLAPTRELAGQIATSFETYGAGQGLRIAMVCGGAKIGPQIRKLERGVHVLVATPGRLIDLMEQRAVSLKDVEILVLDEADQMLDLGFIHALRTIAKHLPQKRQTLFFSATMPKTVEGLAAQYLTDPAEVAVAPPATTAEKIEQRICFVEQSEKQALLAETIRQPDLRTALVFVRTKHGADAVVRRLANADIDAVAIHGNKSQSQRERALQAFKGGKVPVLVATDIAARGIHVDGLTHVINFDLPEVPEQYVHRIGRTARAGHAGIAISFVSKAEREYLRAIEKLIGMKLAPRPADSPDEVHGNGGRRPGQARRGGQSGPRRDASSQQGQNAPRSNKSGGHGKPASAQGGGEAPRGRRPGKQARRRRPEYAGAGSA